MVCFRVLSGVCPAERSASGAESGAKRLDVDFHPHRAIALRAIRVSLSKSSFLSSPFLGCSSWRQSREPGRPVSPLSLVRTVVVLHQLLSGQVRQLAPPTVSYLYDCDDRGLRPI